MASASQEITMELRTVMLGNAGVGKTATANDILGLETFREAKTTECEIQRGRVDSRIISIIDTPGINSATLRSEQLKTEMRRLFSLSDPGPHVFLLVIRVRNFTEDQKNTVEWIQENFGEEALKFTMVLFTGREEMSSSQWRKFSEEDRFQEFVGQCGGGYDVINSKKEANRAQITKLLDKIEKMVQLNGGQFYSNEMYQNIQIKNMEENKNKRSKEGVETERTLRDEKLEHGEKLREIVPDSTKEQKAASSEEESTAEDQGAVGPDVPTIERRRRGSMDIIFPYMTELGIVLLGEAGSGKSATGNTILGRKEFQENLESRTCQTHYTYVEGRHIFVTDTPVITKEGVKRNLNNCVSSTFNGCYVFLLVINSVPGFRKEEVNPIKWIEENFGNGALLHTIVLFNHADQIEEETMDQFFTTRPELRCVVNSCGNRYYTFNSRDKSLSQVTELIEKIDEMIRVNGGWCYTSMTYHERRKKKEEEDKWIIAAVVGGVSALCLLALAAIKE